MNVSKSLRYLWANELDKVYAPPGSFLTIRAASVLFACVFLASVEQWLVIHTASSGSLSPLFHHQLTTPWFILLSQRSELSAFLNSSSNQVTEPHVAGFYFASTPFIGTSPFSSAMLKNQPQNRWLKILTIYSLTILSHCNFLCISRSWLACVQ